MQRDDPRPGRMTGAMYDVVRGFRAGLLLLRSGELYAVGRTDSRLVESRLPGVGGSSYDLYEPASSSAKTVIIVYGLTLRGERDPRVVSLARSFAVSGFRVVVPDLPGLKSFRFDAGDVESVISLASSLHTESGRPVGIVAFSAGAGLSLVAAANPALAGRIDPLLLFGPYYYLGDVWSTVLKVAHRMPAGDDEWEDFVWTRMALAYRVLADLGLTETEKMEFTALLSDYCAEPSVERKRRFYEQVLYKREVNEPPCRETAPDVLERLSPRGKLGALNCRVLILHDSRDRLVPPEHSNSLYEELRSRGRPDAQRLLITPLLSHVTVRCAWKVLDLFRILGIVGEVFR